MLKILFYNILGILIALSPINLKAVNIKYKNESKITLNNYYLHNIENIDPVITWFNPLDIVYGTPLSADQLNAITTIQGTWSYSPGIGTILNAGQNQNLTVTFTPTDLTNYNVVNKTVQINVTKANPVITWSDPSNIVYGTPLSATQLNASTTITGTWVYSPTIGTVLNAGGSQNLNVTFTPTDITNYNVANATVEINVTKANPIITWADPADITYGTPLSATQLNATTTVQGTWVYSPIIGTILNSGASQNLTVTFTPTDQIDYNVVNKTVQINVNEVNPMITWANPSNITYGTPLSATQLNATTTIPGTWVYLPTIGTILNAGASQNLKVTFTPTDLTNYYVTNKTVQINVNKATPVITWANPADIAYGTPLSATQLNASTTIAGTWSYSPLSGTILNAGQNQNISVTFTPTDLTNYNVVNKIVQINVTKITTVITWTNPADIIYGTPLTSIQLNASTTIAGTWVYSPISGTILNAGLNQNLSVTFTPTDIIDYNVVNKTVQINVTKVTPVITWANPADIIYATPLSATQLNASTTIAGNWIYSPLSGTILNAGLNQNLTVTFTPTDITNYNVVNKTVQINVTKATPIITWANPVNITYGTPLSATQLNASTTIAGTWIYTPLNGTILNAGLNQNLSVTFTPTNDTNYNVVNKTVQINVTKANPVIIWANPADITYGTPLSATQLNASTTIAGTWVYTPLNGTILNAGLNQNLSVTFTPTNDTNYNIVNKTVQINVNKANPVITWTNPADITYGTPLSATQLNATTTIAGTWVYAPVSGTVLNAGLNQNLTVTFTPANDTNYNVVNKTVQINVTKLNPVITWANPADITYGTPLSAIQLNATTSIAGTWVYAPVSGTVLNAGLIQNLSVTFTPANDTNYNIVIKTVQINVIKATPYITWANPADITYGTPLSATQLNASTTIAGTWMYSPLNGTVLNAGLNQNLSVTFTPNDITNYNVVNKTVQINVIKASPVITWANPADITYGIPLSSTQLNASTTINGSWVYSPTIGTILNVGLNQNLSVTFTPVNDTNYNIVNKTVQINVTKANPVITWANPVDITYGTPLSATQLNASTTIPGTWIYSPIIGTILNAGLNQSISVTFTPTDISNYNEAYKTVQINVIKADPVIIWPNPADITYGIPLSATQLNASTTILGTWTYSPIIGTVLNAGLNQNLSVTFTPNDISNYNVAYKTVQINVTKTNPVITWANPADITYGTPLSATQLNASTTIAGTWIYNPLSGTILNAGLNQNLSVTFTPTDILNYNVANKTVQINVTLVNPVITWANPADITYGTPLSAIQLNASTTIAGTFVYSPLSGTVLNAGLHQNLFVTFTPNDLTNYNSVDKTVQINVIKADPVITWANPADITYGTPLSATQLNASATIAGTFVYSPISGTVLNAGLGQNLSVTFTPNDLTNYNIFEKTVQINVIAILPNIQAEITEFLNVTDVDFTVNWTRGNGSYCKVFICKTTIGEASPVNGTDYTANPIYSQGDQIGTSGWYCVYDGIGTTVKITGLTNLTDYRVMVVEYNKYLGVNSYLTVTNIKNPLNIKTLSESFIDIQASNYISPNGDGVNDTWIVGRKDELKDFDLYIFNNIGEILYHSIGYDNKWNATYNNKELPKGTYYYLFSKGSISIKGYITVVR